MNLNARGFTEFTKFNLTATYIILKMRDNWYKSDLEKIRLNQAGVDEPVVDAAIGAFILEAVAKHGHPTKVGFLSGKNLK